jgi:hypothetical protein
MRTACLTALLAAGLLLSGAMNVSAADKLTLSGIGTMEIPKGITYDKGAQTALPFMKDGGTKRFFIRKGLSDSQYYTMTWKNGPDFSYGWAMSHEAGIPFLQDIGEFRHKDDKPEAQMDIIAGWLNGQLLSQGAVFDGETPLKKINDSKHPRWEGFVKVKTKEQGIVYNEAYTIILQCDGYFTTLGIFNTDGDRGDITDAVRKMVLKRKFPQKVNLLDLSRKGTSLSEWE